jgi:hypothetical protein
MGNEKKTIKIWKCMNGTENMFHSSQILQNHFFILWADIKGYVSLDFMWIGSFLVSTAPIPSHPISIILWNNE